MKKFENKSCVSYILAFVLPLIITVLAYLNQGIYLGSTNTILIYDMRAQLLALYGYLANLGPGYDNLFYSMSGGLGGGYFGTLALYISPLDFIYSLVSTRYLPDAIYIMTVLKISLCGLTCCVFLKKNYSYKLNNVMAVTLSCCYSLMTYNFMYAMSPMWLDAVMLFPLLALMLEKIIAGRPGLSFALLMSVCIISDYYMGYMCALALIIYFFFRIIENGVEIKVLVRRFITFTLYGILSATISAFVIVPVAMDFGRGKLAEDQSLAMNHVFIKNSFLDIIKSFATQSYATLDYTASPNVFCGSIVLILTLCWIVIGKKNIRGRIATLSVIAIYFISFIFGPVDRIWHGFRDPVGFPIRYAFTFVFFMVYFAGRGYTVLKTYCSDKSKSIFGLVGSLVIFYTFIELYINGGYILSRLAVEQRFANRNEYTKITDVMAELVPDSINQASGYGRISRNFNFSRNDGALYGYDGFDRFSSSYNYALDDLFNKIGIGSLYHTVTEKGINPATAALFDIKYFISYYRDAPDTYNFIDEYRMYKIYENKYCLPLAFGVDESVVYDSDEFGYDPFHNINTIYNDLVGDEAETSDIFKRIEYSRYERDASEFYKEDTIASADFEFQTSDEGMYYFYSDDTEPVPDYTGTWAEGEFSQKLVFADSYIDGVENANFRSDEFSYITVAGEFDENEKHVLSLDSSIGEIGDTWIYYFDDFAFEKIYDLINENGFKIDYINSTGIKVVGKVDEDGYVFFSLPYEDGYKIYVDGVSSEYVPYRNSLLLVPVKAGEHDVVIKYVPPGLHIGLVITFAAFIFVIILLLQNKQNKLKDEGR